MKPVLVSFGSSDLEWSLHRFRKQATRSQLFSRVVVLTESDLDQEFRNKFEPFLKKEVRGFGYWIWKPQSVYQVIKQLPPGTLVIYLDLGCHIFPDRYFSWEAFYDLCLQSSSGLVAFQDDPLDPIALKDSLERVWTKGDLFNYFHVREEAAITDTPQFAAAVFGLVVGAESLRFVESWLRPFFADISLVDDSPSQSSNLPGFLEHRFDQSIFSILCKISECSVLPQDLLQGRKFDADVHGVSSVPWIVARDNAGPLVSGLKWLRLVLKRPKETVFCAR